jgi:WD40 repeat protein
MRESRGLNKVASWIGGYDIFISYRHADAHGYAKNLEQVLESKGLMVFRDESEEETGVALKTFSKRACKARALVVLATPTVFESDNVFAELSSYLSQRIDRWYRRPFSRIITINVEQTLSRAPAERPEWGRLKHFVYETETMEAINSATPSDKVIKSLRSASTFMRSWRRFILLLGASLLGILILIGGALFYLGSVLNELSVKRTELAAAQKESDVLRSTNQTLNNQNAGLTSSNQLLNNKNAGLTSENQVLTGQNVDLQASANSLREESRKLTNANTVLTGQNKNLHEESRQLTYGTNLQLAGSLYDSGQIASFLDVLNGTDPLLRNFEWKYLKHLTEGLVPFEAEDEAINHLIFSPDGKYLVTTGASSAVLIWDSKTGQKQDLGLSGAQASDVSDYAFSGDGKWFASCISGQLILWNTSTNPWTRTRLEAEPVAAVGPTFRMLSHHPDPIENYEFVSFTPQSREMLAVMNFGKEIILRKWDLATRKQIGDDKPISKSLAARKAKVVKFAYDGQLLIRDDEGDFLMNADLVETKLDHEASDVEYRYSFFHDGKRIAIIRNIGEPKEQVIEITDGIATMKSAQTLENSTSETGWKQFVVSPDGARLAAFDNTQMRVWDTTTLKVIKTKAISGAVANSIALAPDNSHLAIGGFDEDFDEEHFLTLWDLNVNRDTFSFNEEEAIAASSDGEKLVALGSRDADGRRALNLWNTLTKTSVTLTTEAFVGNSAKGAFSSDGLKVWIYFYESGRSKGPTATRVWNTISGRELILTSPTQCQYMPALQFSFNAQRLAGLCGDGSFRIWSMENGSELQRFELAREEKSSLETILVHNSPKGILVTESQLAVVGLEDSLIIWDIQSGLRKHPEVCSESIQRLSPDGNWWIARDKDDNYRLRNKKSNRCDQEPILEGRDFLEEIAFSNDGKLLAFLYDELGTGITEAVHYVIKGVTTPFELDIPQRPGEVPPNMGRDIEFSRSGRWVRFGNRYVDRASTQIRLIIGCVSNPTFSNDETRLISSCGDGTLKFWSLASGQEILTLKTNIAAKGQAILTDSNSFLLTVGADGGAELWRTGFH